ncbi:MAG TPA: M12 family metallo-peptidase [Thermoanaerobaculia bacterium]|nr:M12 family metallo-peptidase [Thermoanaerobaculia bacterium]
MRGSHQKRQTGGEKASAVGYATLAALVLSLACGASPAAAANGVAIAEAEAAVAPLPSLTGARLARLDGAQLTRPTPSLAIELDGRALEFTRTDFEDRGGSQVWRGALTGQPGGFAVLSTVAGRTAGYLSDGQRTWQVLPTAAGHVVAEVDRAAERPCGGAQNPGGTGSARLPSSAGAPAAATGPAVIDILALYTREARDLLGGDAEIKALIHNAVDLTNTSFANSGVAATARLARVALHDAPESGDAPQDLERLSQDQEVRDLRQSVHADVVALFTADGGDWCGYGWYFSGLPESGYSVTAAPCAVSYIIFPHELGHNLGADHDPQHAVRPAPARDFVAPGEFRTLMAYAEACNGDCPVIPHFSSPRVNYQGRPTGVAGKQDNASVLAANAPVVANYLSPPAGAGCAASESTLCLGGGRFEARVRYKLANGQQGDAKAVRMTDRAGYYWFFNPENVELTVKLLDACGAYGKHWVFASGMTNVEIDLTVRDTRNGQVRSYHNPQNKPFTTIQDTQAFNSCN